MLKSSLNLKAISKSPIFYVAAIYAAVSLIAFVAGHSYLVLDSLVVGFYYSAIGMGMQIIAGVIGLTNFAHGNFYCLAPYIMYYAVVFGVPAPIALILSVVAVYIVGAAINVGLVRPGLKIGFDYVLLVTFGFGVFLEQVFVVSFPYYLRPTPLLGGGMDVINFFGLDYQALRIWGALFCGMVVFTLYYILDYTTIGKSFRAVRQNRDLAGVVGIDVPKAYTICFALSVASVGIAGCFLTPIFLLSPIAGATALSTALTVSVIGGLGGYLIPGVVVGSFVLAMLETFGAVFVSTAYKFALGFAAVCIILLFRPEGLLGKK